MEFYPSKRLEVRKNECLPPQFAHNEREAYSWQNDGYLASFSHVHSIFKLGIIRSKGKPTVEYSYRFSIRCDVCLNRIHHFFSDHGSCLDLIRRNKSETVFQEFWRLSYLNLSSDLTLRRHYFSVTGEQYSYLCLF